MAGELAFKEFEAVGFVLMLIGGFIELYLPLHYVLKGVYYAVPAINLILALLSFIGCIIVRMGRCIAGGLIGITIGPWILVTGEFFEYRYAAGMLALIGGIISIIVGLVKILQKSREADKSV